MTSEKWLTPKEIAQILGAERTNKLLDDFIYERRSQAELLNEVMESTRCVVHSASDFLRELVKHPNLAE